MTLCEHCLTYAGVYNSTRRCCQVRLIALMPLHRQAQAFAAVREKRGDAARDRLHELVKEEHARWKEYRASLFLP